jgi:rhomboid protease GluP
MSGHLPSRRVRLPLLTIAVMGVTATLTVLARSHPGIVADLRRDPAALRTGQWWRALSPILVQPDRAPIAAAVLLLVTALGVFVELRFGRVRWLVCYLAGAAAGEAAGYLWQPHGAGASVAGCGLLGAVAVWAIRRGPGALRVNGLLWLAFAVVDTVLRDIHGLPILAGALVGLVALPVRRPAGAAQPVA